MMAPRDHGEAHGVDLLQQYISRVDEIIGERTSTEQKYDHEVVRWMRRGKSIRKAIAKANEKYPREALRVNNDNLADVEAHYKYLAEHERQLVTLSAKVQRLSFIHPAGAARKSPDATAALDLAVDSFSAHGFLASSGSRRSMAQWQQG